MAWLLIVVAGAFEVVFALSLGESDGFRRLGPVVAVIVFGTLAVVVLSRALRDLPVSTGYAAFTAIGVVGTTFLGAVTGRDPLDPSRLAALAIVLVGIIALHLTTPTG